LLAALKTRREDSMKDAILNGDFRLKTGCLSQRVQVHVQVYVQVDRERTTGGGSREGGAVQVKVKE
jgi:hypothetical protein